jgi:hypothetical protein
MSRKILPREWTAILSFLAASVGQLLSPETAKAIGDRIAAHAGQGVTAGSLLTALMAIVRIIYVGKKEGSHAASPDSPAAD